MRLFIIVTIITLSMGCDKPIDEESTANNFNNTEAVCGNDFVDMGSTEVCDGTDFVGATCESLGFAGGGTLSCSANCTWDVMACHRHKCGNGVLDPGEVCDGELFTVDATPCTGFGWYYGETVCTDECTLSDETCTGRCGDGILDPGEICDGDPDGSLIFHYGVVWDATHLGTCETHYPGEPGMEWNAPWCLGTCSDVYWTGCRRTWP